MNKAEIRNLYKFKRKELSNELIAQFQRNILLHLFDWLANKNYSSIMLYLPISQLKEIDTHPIIEHLRKYFPDTIISVPVVSGDKMIAVRLEHDTILQLSNMGIPEPTLPHKMVLAENINLAIVPLLAFDSRGIRVGYGKGFYDKFLNQYANRIFKVGLSWFEQLDKDIDDSNTFDVPMNMVITPTKINFYENNQKNILKS